MGEFNFDGLPTSDWDIPRWNYWITNAVDACLGSISENFRAISIEIKGLYLHLNFYLEYPHEEDVESATDIVVDFLSIEGMDVTHNTIIGRQPIINPNFPGD